MGAPFPLHTLSPPLSLGTGNILPNSQFLSNIAAYVAGDVSLPRLIPTLLSPLLPLSPPSGIDQWTYSWPQNFGTGHKLHKTKPNQTGQAEEAAMKCIAMRLSFISCGQRAGASRQYEGNGREGCKSVPHILRFQISAACATPHTRVCHFGSSRKRNYRKSEFKAKWPMALAGQKFPTRDKNFAQPE